MRPILFSTPMVEAILQGQKKMTRRVAKVDNPENWKKSISGTSIVQTAPYDVKLPRFKAGDILWVRETWSTTDECGLYPPWPSTGEHFMYKADDPCCEDAKKARWFPSIHMPRRAARIFLRVTSVRVERVQDITPHDAWCEGCRIGNSFSWDEHIPELQQACRDVAFKSLWDSLNAKRGYGWDANPWVWVIEFERIAAPGKEADDGR